MTTDQLKPTEQQIAKSIEGYTDILIQSFNGLTDKLGYKSISNPIELAAVHRVLRSTVSTALDVWLLATTDAMNRHAAHIDKLREDSQGSHQPEKLQM